MARKFQELRDLMDPDRREANHKAAQEILRDMGPSSLGESYGKTSGSSQ